MLPVQKVSLESLNLAVSGWEEYSSEVKRSLAMRNQKKGTRRWPGDLECGMMRMKE